MYDVGRVISPKLADSQALGRMVGGIGQALLEHGVIDHRDGPIVNADLANYLVPVNTDIPDLKAIYLDGEDYEADPIGVEGIGEIVQLGVAAAPRHAGHTRACQEDPSMLNIAETLYAWCREARPLALATVVDVSGSAPLPPAPPSR